MNASSSNGEREGNGRKCERSSCPSFGEFCPRRVTVTIPSHASAGQDKLRNACDALRHHGYFCILEEYHQTISSTTDTFVRSFDCAIILMMTIISHEETKLRSTLQNGGKPQKSQKPQKPRELQDQIRESHWAAPPPPWHEGSHEGSHEGGQSSRARWSTNSDPSHSIGIRRNGHHGHHQAKDEGSGRSMTSSRSNSRGGASSDICGTRGYWCGEGGGENVAKDPRKVDSASDIGRDRPRRQRRRSKLQHV